ncbi:hypothetical protein V2J09_004194 [Rumex salicifolius]
MADKVVSDDGVELLSAINDVHGGVIVEMRDPMDSKVFQTMLKASMLKWIQEGKKGVWLKLPIGLANLIESAVQIMSQSQEGFWYHHAEPNYLMLVQWIPKINSTIPANASHRVRVGAIVINDKRELLVVQEISGRFRGTGIWKIPTGVLEEGEDVHTAVMREVKEETGIDTEFIEILAFRQSHKMFFGKSDMFFICFLRPLSFDIQIQELEIEAAQWMPLDEFAVQPIVEKHGVFKLVVDLCTSKLETNYCGFKPLPLLSFMSPNTSCVYLKPIDLVSSDSSDQH